MERWFRETVGMLPRPDLAVLVHSPVDVAVQRIRRRPAERERPIDFAHMAKVYEGFRRLVEDGHLVGLDTSVLSIDDTLAAVLDRVGSLAQSPERSLAG
jgi:thymidylate kinase